MFAFVFPPSNSWPQICLMIVKRGCNIQCQQKIHKNIYTSDVNYSTFIYLCISQRAVPTKIYCFQWNFHKNIQNVYFLHPRPISHHLVHMSQPQDEVYTSTPIYLILISLLPFNPHLTSKSELHATYPPISTLCTFLTNPSLLHAKLFSSIECIILKYLPKCQNC